MSYQGLAFFTGLFGSLHCAAMCGPLVMALPYPGNPWSALMQKLLHQTGRISTYMLMGLLVGTLGHSFDLLGLQSPLSVIAGLLLIFSAWLFLRKPGFTLPTAGLSSVYQWISGSLSHLLSRSYGGFLTGLLHGLLPCGMVYMALAAALSVDGIEQSIGFMFYFGLGTSPVLLIASFAPLSIRKWRAGRLLIPAMMLLAGIILVVRGLNIQIPYLIEPVNQTQGVAIC